jgi:hypothetical protein
MKKSFLLFIFIARISCFTLLAQPTLTSSFNPVVGDVFSSAYVDTASLPQGPSGANQTWDFSSLTSAGTFSSNVVTVASTPYASSYPSATIATSDGNGGYGYASTNSTQYQIWGLYNSAESVILTNSEVGLTYPFTYSSTLSDNFSGSGSSSFPFNRTGTITVVADAWGTIKTPEGTFTNALRINQKQVINDNFGSSIGIEKSVTQTYEWYIEGYKNSLLAITYDTTFDQFGDTIPVFSVSYGLNAPSAVKNITPAISFNIFPNPTTDRIYLQAGESINHVIISNVLGQNVIDMQPENGSSHNPVEISVADLPSGIYFCSVNTPVGNVTRRIVKE